MHCLLQYLVDPYMCLGSNPGQQTSSTSNLSLSMRSGSLSNSGSSNASNRSRTPPGEKCSELYYIFAWNMYYKHQMYVYWWPHWDWASWDKDPNGYWCCWDFVVTKWNQDPDSDRDRFDYMITDAKGTINESEWQLSQHMALMSFQSTQDGPTGGQEDDAMSVDFNTCD